MESYHQVETTLQDYEFDYEDYPEYGYGMVRTARPELSPYVVYSVHVQYCVRVYIVLWTCV